MKALPLLALLFGFLVNGSCQTHNVYVDSAEAVNSLTDSRKWHYYYDKAIAADTANTKIYIDRAAAKIRMKNFKAAFEDYRRAIKYIPFPKYKSALEQEIGEFTVGVGLYPSEPLGYYYRGLLEIYIYSYDEALTDLDSAVQLDPKYADAYYLRGCLKELRPNSGEPADDFAIAAGMGHPGAISALKKIRERKEHPEPTSPRPDCDSLKKH